MKLWYSPISPFVRKVMVTAREAGIEGRLETVEVTTNTIDTSEDLLKANPLGKIPALDLFDGRTLFDSRVICAYLVELAQNGTLIPRDSEARLNAMVLEALGDGISDAAVNVRYEISLRPEDRRYAPWMDGQKRKVVTALDSLERDWIETLNQPVTVGAIAVGCALGYLDLRFGDMNWRASRPDLAAWFNEFSQRPSMAETTPKA